MIYNDIFIFLFKMAYNIPNKYIDKGLLELFGPLRGYVASRLVAYSVEVLNLYVIFFIVGAMFCFIV